jgi:nicotinamidase-related amidase
MLTVLIKRARKAKKQGWLAHRGSGKEGELTAARHSLAYPEPGRAWLGGRVVRAGAGRDWIRRTAPVERGRREWPAIPDDILEFSGTKACIQESIRIADRYISPSIKAARAAGLPIFHVEPAFIARKYDSVRHMLDEEDLNPPPAKPMPPEVNPGWVKHIAARCYGGAYWDWQGHARMDVIASCKPDPGDQMILTGRQLDRICRSKGIKNLVYTGFNSNMCILTSAAATQDMLKYGYRIFLIREATLAVEYPETLAEQVVTQMALKYYMLKVGDTVGFSQFFDACRAVTESKGLPFPVVL